MSWNFRNIDLIISVYFVIEVILRIIALTPKGIRFRYIIILIGCLYFQYSLVRSPGIILLTLLWSSSPSQQLLPPLLWSPASRGKRRRRWTATCVSARPNQWQGRGWVFWWSFEASGSSDLSGSSDSTLNTGEEIDGSDMFVMILWSGGWWRESDSWSVRIRGGFRWMAMTWI